MIYSHFSVDVFAGYDALGKPTWWAMDAHFNVTLTDGTGNKLSWYQVADRLKNGLPVVQVQDAGGCKPGLCFEDADREYGVGWLKDETCYLVIRPAWLNVPGTLSTGGVVQPEGWDGKISYPSGSVFDALATSGSPFYLDLAQGK